MKIANFTESELNLLREKCHFVDPEDKCFELKAKGCTDVQLSVRLNISESMIAVHMRRVRAKITYVLEEEAKKKEKEQQKRIDSCGTCPGKVYHTMDEWARIPDFLSTKGTEYIYADYRTEIINGKEVNIPRVKYGDGVTPVSELPFATSSITDKDMDNWDNVDEFGKIVIIDDAFKDEPFAFPVDGYLMLEFKSAFDFAKVKVLGASGQLFFDFEKPRQVNIHSKEVYVRRGMKCQFIYASDGATVKFHPIV